MVAKQNPVTLYARAERHSASNGSLIVAFLWGLAEATIFFIVPDLYLGFVTLFHWRRGLLATFVAVVGAMAGGMVMYALAAANGAAINELLVRIPLISPDLVRTVAGQMEGSGLLAMVSGPLEAIPYKIYATQAGQQHLPFIPFLFLTILARLERLLPVALASAVCGTVFKRFIQRHTALVVSAYGLLWVGVYVLYYLRMR